VKPAVGVSIRLKTTVFLWGRVSVPIRSMVMDEIWSQDEIGF